MQAEHGEFQTDYESFCGMFKLFQLKDQEHDQVPSRRVQARTIVPPGTPSRRRAGS